MRIFEAINRMDAIFDGFFDAYGGRTEEDNEALRIMKECMYHMDESKLSKKEEEENK